MDLSLEVERWFETQGFRIVMTGRHDGICVDLVGDINPDVVFPAYAIAPDPVLAVLAAEQRWLVEEEGEGSAPGATYIDKARARLRKASSAAGQET